VRPLEPVERPYGISPLNSGVDKDLGKFREPDKARGINAARIFDNVGLAKLIRRNRCGHSEKRNHGVFLMVNALDHL
jgi:hypothetical protein